MAAVSATDTPAGLVDEAEAKFGKLLVSGVEYEDAVQQAVCAVVFSGVVDPETVDGEYRVLEQALRLRLEGPSPPLPTPPFNPMPMPVTTVQVLHARPPRAVVRRVRVRSRRRQRTTRAVRRARSPGRPPSADDESEPAPVARRRR